MNDKEKKPKCHGCGERGNDTHYYWHQVRGDGHLWHWECIRKIFEELQSNSVDSKQLK